MPINLVLPPLEFCRGTRPSQAANCLPFAKALPIADGGNNRRGNYRADALHRCDALAALARTKRPLDASISSFDLLLEIDQFLVQARKELPSKTAQPTLCIFQNLRQSTTQLRYMLRQDDTKLSQQTADLVDQLRPASYQATAYPVPSLHILLLDRLQRYKTHVRPHDCLCNGFGIVGLVLVRLHAGLEN